MEYEVRSYLNPRAGDYGLFSALTYHVPRRSQRMV